mmetsp:Transcript_18372/g.42905  ORF Transcript_18372/g.42905 Transcript_18372/m.42905 type:complete len:208 (+) Transcript_18372:87-710(+)
MAPTGLWVIAVLLTLLGIARAGSIVRSAVDAHGSASNNIHLHEIGRRPNDDDGAEASEGDNDAEMPVEEWQDGSAADELQAEDAGVQDFHEDRFEEEHEEAKPPEWYCRRRAWCRTDSRRRGTEARLIESRRRLVGTDSRRREYFVRWVPAPAPPTNAYWQQNPQQQGFYPGDNAVPPPWMSPDQNSNMGPNPFVYGAAPDWPIDGR